MCLILTKDYTDCGEQVGISQAYMEAGVYVTIVIAVLLVHRSLSKMVEPVQRL